MIRDFWNTINNPQKVSLNILTDKMVSIQIVDEDRMSFANPGDMRISLKTALEGGVSDPRNTTLMKMFGLIGVGERAGSGVPSIVSVWSGATGLVPTYKQPFAPERVEFIIKMGSLSDTSADNLPVANTKGTTEKTVEKSLQKSS